MEGLKSRAVALIVCVALILVGWFGGSALQSMGSNSLTAQASGLKPKTVVMQIGDQKVTAGAYLYWLTSTCDMIYQYYGITDWSTLVTADLTAGDYAKEQADYYVSQYAAIEQIAAEQGVTLTEEQQADLDGLMDTYIEYYGSEELYRYMMNYAGLDEETLLDISAVPYLYSNLCEKLLDKGGVLEATEENLQAYAERNQFTDLSDEQLLLYYQDTSYGAVYDYVNDYIDEMTVEKNEKYDSIDVETFYTALQTARENLAVPETGESDGDTDASTEE